MGQNSAVPHVGIVGCGYWGKNLVRNMSSLGALAAVCDDDAAVAAKYAAEHGVQALTFETMLRTPDITGVVVAAPAELHADLATRALNAGKHVYVEKPMALSVEEGEALARHAAASNRVLMVGHLLQYHPAFRILLDLVQKGALGKLRYIYSNRLNLGKIRREENVFWSFAPHDISMILALAGGLPRKIFAQGSYYLNKGVADVTTTTFDFESGVSGHIFVSWLHPFKEQKLVVVGEEAMVVFDDLKPWAQKLEIYRHSVEWNDGMPVPTHAKGENIAIPDAEPLRLECEHFLECMAHGHVPLTDAQEGLRVLKVLAAAQESMNSGSEVLL